MKKYSWSHVVEHGGTKPVLLLQHVPFDKTSPWCELHEADGGYVVRKMKVSEGGSDRCLRRVEIKSSEFSSRASALGMPYAEIAMQRAELMLDGDSSRKAMRRR